MPFAKANREAMYPDFHAQGAYVDYKVLKDILHRMKVDVANPATPDELWQQLLKQKQRVWEWCAAKVKEVLTIAQALDKESLELLGSVSVRSTAEELQHSADAVLYELLRFQECRNLNADIVHHIVERQYRSTALSPTGKWRDVDHHRDLATFALDEPLFLLSRVYDRVRQALAGEEGDSSHLPGAMGSQVFDRRSVKYLVHEQDLPFVLARIVRYLPLSTVGDTYAESQKLGQTFSLGQRISSVYYDNRDFWLYHRRLERLEKCFLIRLRWYTPTAQADSDEVPPDSDVFVEIKVHREAWCGERSTKKRFAIRERHVDAYLQRTHDFTAATDRLRRKKATEAEIGAFVSLATDIAQKIEDHSLKPVLRTKCRRAAFQQGSSQRVRVSIDTELHMDVEDFGLGQRWRYEGKESLGRTDVPHAVVEVKLQFAENERLPPWIEELMKCRYMEAVPKFSKYAHGIAKLYGHTNRITLLPYWVEQLDTADIRAAYKPDDVDLTRGLAVGSIERSIDTAIFGSAAPQNPSVGAAEAQFLNATTYVERYEVLRRRIIGGSRRRPPDPSEALLERRHQSYVRHGLTSDPVEEAGCLWGDDEKEGIKLPDGSMIPWQYSKRIRVPQRFDPKTLFTAERYMLQWLQKAIFLGSAGVAVIAMANSARLPSSRYYANGPTMHIFVGLVFVALAFAVGVYSLVAFHARARRIYARQKIRYDDERGPTILTMVLMAAVAYLCLDYVGLRYGPMITRSDGF